jgi:hypothetical protein
VGIGNQDCGKAQFPLTIRSFEPKPEDGKGKVQILELHLETAPDMTIQVFETAIVLQGKVDDGIVHLSLPQQHFHLG